MDDQRKPLPKGQFQEYEIVDTIGFGGSSICYLIKRGHAFFILKELYPMDLSIHLDRDGILLRSNQSDDNLMKKQMAIYKEDFLQEAEISKDLSQFRRVEDLVGENPYFFNLVESFDIDDSLSYYLVYQSKQGKTLQDFFCNSRESSLNRAVGVLNLMKQVAEAVTEVHEYGYLHLDLKLDNIFVIAYRSPTIVLLDLGSAIKTERLVDQDASHLIRRISYSERYSSPKLHAIYRQKLKAFQMQRLGYSANQLSELWQDIFKDILTLKCSDDIYSLYVMLCELLTSSTFHYDTFSQSIMSSQTLTFAHDFVKNEISSRVSSALLNENRTMDQFIKDMYELREIFLTEGVHPVILKLKSESLLNKRISNLKFEVNKGIFTSFEYSSLGITNSFENLTEYFKKHDFKLSSNHVLVVGEGGSGKSTQLIQLWKYFIEETKNIIPFYIPLLEFQGDQYNQIIDYILHYYSGDITVNQRDQLVKQFEDDQRHLYVLLLDGFNELTNKDLLYSQIERLSKFGSVKLVITSRYSYSAYLPHVTLNVKGLIEDQIIGYLELTGKTNIDINELYKNPMMLTLASKSSYYLSRNLISNKDFENLDIRSANNKMELIKNFISAQKVKHFISFNRRWEDERVMLRLIAFDVILPQIAKIMFESNINSLSLDSLTKELLNYFTSKKKSHFSTQLTRKIYSYERLIPFDTDRFRNEILIDLLCEEFALVQISNQVNFVSEVFQEYFLSSQLSREIKSPDDMCRPLFAMHRFNYEHLRNLGHLLQEYRFADPTVNGFGHSDVEHFLNKYRNIYDGSTRLLVQNAVELMKIGRSGLVLADLSYLDLRECKFDGIVFSTIGEVESKPTSFRGSFMPKDIFESNKHRGTVDRIFTSPNGNFVATYSKNERITKIWDIENKAYITEFKGDYSSQMFIDNRFIACVEEREYLFGSLFVEKIEIHDVTNSNNIEFHTPDIQRIFNIIDKKYEISILGSIDNEIFFGILLNTGDENQELQIWKSQINDTGILEPVYLNCIDAGNKFVYGVSKKIHEESIFKHVSGLFVILLSKENHSSNTKSTSIEIVDVYRGKKLGSVSKDIKDDTRFFFSHSTQCLIFNTINNKYQVQTVLAWNIETNSIVNLGNPNDPNASALLGIDELTRMVYIDSGNHITVRKSLDGYNVATKKTYFIPRFTNNSEDSKVGKFIVRNGKVTLLFEREMSVLQLNSDTGETVNKVKVSRYSQFTCLHFADNVAYIVFSNKIYLLNLISNTMFKSLYEIPDTKNSYSSVDLNLRMKSSSDSKYFQSIKDIMNLNFEKGLYKHNVKYISRYSSRNSNTQSRPLINRLFQHEDGSEFRILLDNDCNYLSRIEHNDHKSIIDLEQLIDEADFVFKVIGQELYFIMNSKLIRIDLSTFETEMISFNLQKQFYDYIEFNRKVLEHAIDTTTIIEVFSDIFNDGFVIHVRDFGHKSSSSVNLFYLVVGDSMLLFQKIKGNDSEIEIVGIMQNIICACFTDNSIYLINDEASLSAIDLSERLLKNQRIRNSDFYNSRKLKFKAVDTDVSSDNGLYYHNDYLFWFYNSDNIRIWDLESDVYYGRINFEDTNINGCDFSEVKVIDTNHKLHLNSIDDRSMLLFKDFLRKMISSIKYLSDHANTLIIRVTRYQYRIWMDNPDCISRNGGIISWAMEKNDNAEIKVLLEECSNVFESLQRNCEDFISDQTTYAFFKKYKFYLEDDIIEDYIWRISQHILLFIEAKCPELQHDKSINLDDLLGYPKHYFNNRWRK